MPVHPELKPVLELLAASEAPPIEELSPVEARALYKRFARPSPPVELARVEDARIPGPAGEIGARIYRPRLDRDLPVLVSFHGGGWVIGDLDTHEGSCRQLARNADCVVVSVDYRLAPEHPYPAAVEDAHAAVQWVAGRADELGVDPRRIAVGGDSAGGNLAAAVALVARDRGGPPLCFQLLVYPATDADFTRPSVRRNARGYLLETSTMQWFWDQYVPDPARRREPYCAPLRADDLSGLPPALIVTAEYDPLLDEGEAYARRLAEAGVAVTCTRYDGMIHGFFGMGMLAQGARDAMAEASQALRAAFA